ncbi:hypothetical protein V6N13_072382 [Hibiscus sabdariffa]
MSRSTWSLLCSLALVDCRHFGHSSRLQDTGGRRQTTHSHRPQLLQWRRTKENETKILSRFWLITIPSPPQRNTPKLPNTTRSKTK